MDATPRHDDRLLFTRLRTEGSASDRETVVRRYLPLAHRLAHRYRHTGEPMEDLEQVASVGLLNAIDRFDPDLGPCFSSFAVPTILGELRQYFRDHIWQLRAPQRLQTLTIRIERVRDDLVPSLGRQPTVTELSEHLCAPEELILEAGLAHPVPQPGTHARRGGVRRGQASQLRGPSTHERRAPAR